MKIKLITPNAGHAREWHAALAGLGGLSVDVIDKALRSVNVLINGSRPDLVVAETIDALDLLALDTLAQAHPDIEIVLVSAELTQDLLLRLMRAGVREVLPAPASGEAVAAAVQRLARQRPQGAAAAPPRQGEVFSVLSCKGGSGATFVAANLAAVMAAGGQRRVALIDLNLQFGDAALFVSSERPGSDVADVARNVSRLDRELLQAAMLHATPGLWVLAAPEDPARSTEVQPEHVKAILQMARGCFDFVVLDLGRTLSTLTLEALDHSDRVFAVLQLTLPFIRDGKRLRDVFRSLDYPARKIQWLVNRHDKSSRLTLADARAALGVTDLAVLPNDYAVVAASVNQGLPVDGLAPGSAIAKALRELAARLAPAPGKPPTARRWLAGLLPGPARV